MSEVPFERTIAAVPAPTATGDDVRSYVNTNFRRLGLFVERELFLRESSSELEPNGFAAEEIVDEVVARALDDRMEKPDRLALEAWFYRLARQAITELSVRSQGRESDVELQRPRRRRNERASDEPHLQFHQPDEVMTGESVVRDDRLATPEQIAYGDEMVKLIQLALSGSHPEDREAFILHALEGFQVEEIAAITDRRPESVQQSIGRAREKLRHSFLPNNLSKKKLLQEVQPVNREVS